MSKVEIVSRVRIFEGFFKIDEVHFHHQRTDGSRSPLLKRVSLDRGDGVAVVVHNTTNGTVVLVRQFRYSTHEKGPGWMLELPAGVIEVDHSPEETVCREVLEETGFSIRNPQFIGSYYLTPGGSSERILLYYCRVTATDRVGPGGGLEEEGEDIEIVEVPTADLLAKLGGGFVVDAKTTIGLYWLSYRL